MSPLATNVGLRLTVTAFPVVIGPLLLIAAVGATSPTVPVTGKLNVSPPALSASVARVVGRQRYRAAHRAHRRSVLLHDKRRGISDGTDIVPPL